jgi:YfiR/HmsC-like
MRRKYLLLHALLLGLAGRSPGGDLPLEYQVKAVCIFNAIRFVSWPASVFGAADDPIVIGILGENPFGTLLHDAVNGQTVRQRRIVVRQVGLAQAGDCHVVFVSRSERDRLEKVLQKIAGSNILTISELENFAVDGGVLGLTLERGKIRFEINSEAAKRAGLKIDSQLLALSRIVK